MGISVFVIEKLCVMIRLVSTETIQPSITQPTVPVRKYVRRPYFWIGVFVQVVIESIMVFCRPQLFPVFSSFQEKTGLSYYLIFEIVGILCLVILIFCFNKKDITLQQDSLIRGHKMQAIGKMFLGLFLGYFIATALLLVFSMLGLFIKCILLNTC